MNSSQFMDKQIMGLAGSGSVGGGGGGGGELFDLMNPQEERHGDNNGAGVLKKEEIYPSYDFQIINCLVTNFERDQVFLKEGQQLLMYTVSLSSSETSAAKRLQIYKQMTAVRSRLVLNTKRSRSSESIKSEIDRRRAMSVPAAPLTAVRSRLVLRQNEEACPLYRNCITSRKTS